MPALGAFRATSPARPLEPLTAARSRGPVASAVMLATLNVLSARDPSTGGAKGVGRVPRCVVASQQLQLQQQQQRSQLGWA
eukprot:5145632-Alexandrium_andersonii.AAC.1